MTSIMSITIFDGMSRYLSTRLDCSPSPPNSLLVTRCRYGTEPFAEANGKIPQVNLWDDHDVSRPLDTPGNATPYTWLTSPQIIDGFGSYTDDFMQCAVFRGIGGTAHKYYLLFQHHLAPPLSTFTTGRVLEYGH